MDLGINNNAACSIMQPNGTVAGRKFINLPTEKDHLYKALNRIKNQSGKEGAFVVGYYLNPDKEKFLIDIKSPIYVDKTELITHLNKIINTQQRYICVSRPRRFGKTMATSMLSAYYNCTVDADELFHGLKITKNPSYLEYKNKFDVIMINMQEFLSSSDSIESMLSILQQRVIKEIKKTYYIEGMDEERLYWAMQDVYAHTGRAFVILIDEWDCMFREYRDNTKAQKAYLDFLRVWLKDQVYVGLAYMTGILPIKKYGTHSALNMFYEYSMTDPKTFVPYFGFTESEVEVLCKKYDMSVEETKEWYDGYHFQNENDTISIYSPKSMVEAMLFRKFGPYWNQTETYEALKVYIQLNYDGLKDAVITMLAGGNVTIDTGTFTNDMTTFANRDDVLTLLIHLGYLTYDSLISSVSIPNKEVGMEYVNSIKSIGWSEVIRQIENSRKLLEALWNMDSVSVAQGIDEAHQQVSILQYNDENALSYTINLAFYYAKEYYKFIRELPSGKGFADVCLIPRKKHTDKPAIIIELKWDKAVNAAISQIKEKQYVAALDEYKDNLLLVGINYDKGTKIHTCEIERYKL